MRRSGRGIADKLLDRTLSPQRAAENIDFFGFIGVDIEGALTQLGPNGDRPLREGDILFWRVRSSGPTRLSNGSLTGLPQRRAAQLSPLGLQGPWRGA